MATIRELAEEHWQGRGDLVHAHHPVQPVHVHHDDGTLSTASEEIDEGLLTLKSIASVNALDTGDGLVMLDTGGAFDRRTVFDAVRGWRPDAPVRAAVYSHHHVDHVLGTALFDAEAADKGWERPVVYAHEELPAHFRRYEQTGGWNTAINRRQFAIDVPTVLVAERVPRPRRHLREAADVQSRRPHLRVAPRPRRDRRRHVDVGARTQGAPSRRPLHLGAPERRQPPEGAALPVRLGCGAAPDGRAATRDPARRARAADLRCRPHRGGAHRHRRAARVGREPDAGDHEPGQEPRHVPARGDRSGPPGRQTVPAGGVRPPAVPDPQRVAPLRRLVGRRAGQPAALAASAAGCRVGRARRRRRPVLAVPSRCSPPATPALACHLVEFAALAAPDNADVWNVRAHGTAEHTRTAHLLDGPQPARHAAIASEQGKRDLAGDY